MRYRPKSIDALQIAVGGLPNKMRVEVDRDIGVAAKTVGELRKLTAWPENLVVTTPPGIDPAGTIKVSKVSMATRVSPVRFADLRRAGGVTVAKISRKRRPEDCSRVRGHGTSRFRHSDMQRRFSRSHNRPSTEPRQDCIASRNS